jgi:flavin-dependent dehydrogenase
MASHHTWHWPADQTHSESRTLPSRYDVIVIGARCAGAATAMLLARRGLKVLVVDRGRYGSDTVSTHALMRGAVLQLHKWGLTRAFSAVPAITKATFFYGDASEEIAIEPRHGVESLFAPRRTLLDRVLVDAALAGGAEVVHGTHLLQVLRARNGRANGVALDVDSGSHQQVVADLVVGADGLRSTVAKIVNTHAYRSGRHAAAMVYGHWLGIAAEGYGWYFRPGMSAGVIPTNGGHCVFVSVPASQFAETFRGSVAAGYHRLLSDISPELAYKVARAQRLGSLHGFPGRAGFFRQSWGAGWALVGDAGAFMDPLTVHGITDAFRDAELLADAVAVGTDAALAQYQARRDEMARDLFDITDDIASFEWNLDTLRPMLEALANALSNEEKVIAAASTAPAAPRPSSAPPPGETGEQLRVGHRE